MQLNQNQVQDALPWQPLIDALRTMFTRDVVSPIRHHHTLSVPESPDATLLLMPAWLPGEYLGVKQVNVFPGNSAKNLPGLSSNYLLSCGQTGQLLAQIDGNELTARRTAAASALASSYLSREDSRTMLMVGAGRVARRLIPAHMSVRPLDTIHIWDINQAAAKQLATELRDRGINASACTDAELESVAREADLISCATLSTTPIIKGAWLKPGAHLDLVGSFTPTMREADNEAMQRAALFVDVKAAALVETGELILPIQDGAIDESHILAGFAELCSGAHTGRAALAAPDTAITAFKSVGDSREDLAAAVLAYQQMA
ncbi:ornithine cyclodeaminase family protein [Photobacterium atrarenae]|uniref:Ornithine cyclodeaminase family protein n=1 Tax=Photobacterium atrarenae TaxID=865757 RepID=A0ABY5GGC4_9GAMM|nr:ornithine cyclodeaminase family protein [Photobacterium atrarenae]UTV27865.1 ornithine cyclodeaminase family protein [Photobacterium atrarenae]